MGPHSSLGSLGLGTAVLKTKAVSADLQHCAPGAGDGEEVLVEIGECLKQCKADRLDRVETLFRLATSVEGVYVPQFYQSIEGQCQRRPGHRCCCCCCCCCCYCCRLASPGCSQEADAATHTPHGPS
jgi:hypothetical protein